MRICPELRGEVYPITGDLDDDKISHLLKKTSDNWEIKFTEKSIDLIPLDTKRVLYQLNIHKHVGKIVNSFKKKLTQLNSKHTKGVSDFDAILFG